MPSLAVEQPEWIDGFLFVGNHLALNFLNTKPVLDDGPHEFLPDIKALQRWVVAAGLVVSPDSKAALRRSRDGSRAARFMKALRGFRERLRAAVMRIESGSPPAESFVAEVNQLLAKHPRRTALVRKGRSLIRAYPFIPDEPDALWAVVGEAVAALLAETNHARIRKCESCVIHFLDSSKKGSRRWCSMTICGNRIKVARYQRRKRKAN